MRRHNWQAGTTEGNGLSDLGLVDLVVQRAVDKFAEKTHDLL